LANPSKAKGTAFESKIVKLLTEKIPNITFMRVPLSGATANMKGDIMPKLEFYHLWEYCIECKHYEQVNWNGLLTAKSCDLLSFWEQAVREAGEMNKKPLLIYRWNRSKDFVCWADDTDIDLQLHYKGFGHEFKMGLLEEWLNAYNSKK
jgi:hypothetical protein